MHHRMERNTSYCLRIFTPQIHWKIFRDKGWIWGGGKKCKSGVCLTTKKKKYMDRVCDGAIYNNIQVGERVEQRPPPRCWLSRSELGCFPLSVRAISTGRRAPLLAGVASRGMLHTNTLAPLLALSLSARIIHETSPVIFVIYDDEGVGAFADTHTRTWQEKNPINLLWNNSINKMFFFFIQPLHVFY